MSDPFFIEGPAILGVSGGRTSGYLLWRILQAHGGKLPADVVPCFENTGKEDPLTLDFIHEIELRWNVEIHWLEWRPAPETKDRWQRVTYETAARQGEPFAALIRQKYFLPNPVTRMCTYNLKAKTAEQYGINGLGWDEWLNVVGLRADEPHRVSRILARTQDRWTNACPLAAAGIDKQKILAFWRASHFDLQLPAGPDGTTPEGNCDLCYLKGPRKIFSLIQRDPSRADWWIQMETEAGATFRNDRPSYAVMKRMALSHDDLFSGKRETPLGGIEDDTPDTIDCACTD